MEKYRLVCDFVGEGEGELHVKANDLVLGLTSLPENGWLHVKTLREPIQDGFVPFSYLKKVNKPTNANVTVPKTTSFNSDHLLNNGTSKPKARSSAANLKTSTSSITNSKPSNPFDELDFIQQAQPEKFKKTLELWRERERRFLAGEEEKLPQPKTRIYFYWDNYGVRHGPLTEAQMRARFEEKKVDLHTKISLAVDEDQKEIGKETIQEYFPEIQNAFKAAPIVKEVGGGTLLWCYRDDHGAIQGPFSSEQMYNWFQDGYFNADTMVRLSTQKDSELVRLQKLFPDGSGAFLTKGDQASAYASSGVVSAGVAALSDMYGSTAKASETRATAASIDLYGSGPTFVSQIDSGNGIDLFGDGFSSTATGTNPFAPINDTTGGWGVAESENVYVPPPTAAWDDPLPPTEVLRPDAYHEFDPLSTSYSQHGETGKKLLVHALSRDESDFFSSAANDLPLATATATATAMPSSFPVPEAVAPPLQEEEAPMLIGDVPLKHHESEGPPPPEDKSSEKPTQPARIVADLNAIQQKHLSSIEKTYMFCTRALSKDLGTVQCRIRRSISGVHVNYNIYELYLEKEGKRKYGPQLLRAVKHKRFGVSNYYEISLGEIAGKEKGKVIARLQLNTLGTNFVLHNDVPAHKGKGRDLCALHYISNISKNKGPRKMKVVIPKFKKGSESEFVEFPHNGSTKKSKMLQALHKFDFQNLQTLINKPPKWSKKHHAWTLNFHGRVTRSSVKNFQLVTPEDHDHIVLQHGKIGIDSFSMDMQWPITPVMAFAICLSSLHSKLAVE